MWGARGTTLLGLALIAVAGLFDAGRSTSRASRSPRSASAPRSGCALGATARGSSARSAARASSRRSRCSSSSRSAAGASRRRPAQIEDPLLAVPAPLTAGRRRTRLRIHARFARRGRRMLAAAARRLPRPARARPAPPDGRRGPATRCWSCRASSRCWLPAGERRGGDRRARATARGRAEVDLDGLRPHRAGTPASRIDWPVSPAGASCSSAGCAPTPTRARSSSLDLRGRRERGTPTPPCAPRPRCPCTWPSAAGSRCCSPGDRRPMAIGSGGHGWPQAHVRLALATAGRGPGRRGAHGPPRAR